MRATFFHLGVIRYLRSIGRLKDVECIFAVSGGSITAAHLVKNWKLYNSEPNDFEKAASELTRFGGRDVRGRIVRRLPMTFLRSIFPRRMWGIFRTSTDLLVREYEKLFGRIRFSELYEEVASSEQCDLYVLSTRMSDGQPCIMSRDGVVLSGAQVIPGDIRVPLAIACSSAFPPMFAPMIIDDETFPSLGASVYALTDGGVFDNLGFETAASVVAQKYPAVGEIIVSDASGPLDQGTNKTFWWYIGRLTRITDILMNTISSTTTAKLSQQIGSTQLTKVSINDRFPTSSKPNLPDVVQQFAPYVRTDLDLFSEQEILSLECHGCGVASKVNAGQKTLGPITPNFDFYPKWRKFSQDDDNPIQNSDRSKKRFFAWWDFASYPVPILISLFTLYLFLPAILVADNADRARSEALATKNFNTILNERNDLERQLSDTRLLLDEQTRVPTELECRNPANGIERYERTFPVVRTSDWMRGGHTQSEFCNTALENLRSTEPAGSVFQIANSFETTRDSCAPFRCIQYQYTCNIIVNTQPIYKLDDRPECQRAGLR